MDNRPIGVFDSGIGGLTAVSALKDVLRYENLIYFGDTGRCPYGTRTREQVRRYTRENLEFLASFNCKAMIAACGTVAASALDILEEYRIPTFNVLVPGSERMTRVPGNRPLAVTATKRSIDSGAYQRTMEELGTGSREVLYIPCQDFVVLCETGHVDRNDPMLKEAVARYLTPAKEAGVSALLLGCTHFGIIQSAIQDFMGEETEIISASQSAADALADYVIENRLQGTNSSCRYFASGNLEEFDRMARFILPGRYNGHAEKASTGLP